MDREKWLNGWHRSGKVVSMGGSIRCAGCGRNFGRTLSSITHEGYAYGPPDKDPDWPFEEGKCPICDHIAFEEGGRSQDFIKN